MRTRSAKQLENDVKRLQQEAKTATSMKELEKATGLSSTLITITLCDQPSILEEIRKQLAENKKIATLKREQQKKSLKNFVIDSSMIGVDGMRELLKRICKSGAKIILTNVVREELTISKHYDGMSGEDAEYILRQVAQKPDCFESVVIDESLIIADNCLVKYCAENNKTVVLLTADQEMVPKAREKGVETYYFPKPEQQKAAIQKEVTLIYAEFKSNTLVITNSMTIAVRVNGKTYIGEKELNIGDDVYICKLKEHHITFVHYRVTSISEKNNSELIYSKRIFLDTSVEHLKEDYASFINEFRAKYAVLLSTQL